MQTLARLPACLACLRKNAIIFTTTGNADRNHKLRGGGVWQASDRPLFALKGGGGGAKIENVSLP